MFNSLFQAVGAKFSSILKGNDQHYGAHTGHGGQFMPREALANAAFELGKHAANGTTAPASLRLHANRLKGVVEATHGRHVAKNVYKEHFARGKASANAPASAPAVPATPVATPAPTSVATPAPSAPATPTHAVQTIPAQRFENTSNGHNKFWTVGVHGNHLVKHWGAIGTAGQKQVKEFSSPQAAKNQADLMSMAKRANGYHAKGASNITENLPVLPALATSPVPPATPVPVTPNVPVSAQGVNHPTTPATTHAQPTLTKEQALKELGDAAFNHGAAERYVSLHSSLNGSDTEHSKGKLDIARANAKVAGVSSDEGMTHILTHKNKGRQAIDYYHSISPLTNSLMTPIEASEAARMHINHPNQSVQVTAPQTPTVNPVPETPHVPEAAQGLNHPDPHGLAKLDTPSKMKNAVYTAAHNYHSALNVGLPTAVHADKLNAVYGYARARLGTTDVRAMGDRAKQDVQNGTYKLPFKARSRNNLPLAAQSGSTPQAPSPLPLAAQPKFVQQAQPEVSEKDKVTQELHEMWHQRGRNTADYANTNIQTDEMRALQKAATAHEEKLKALGVSPAIITAQREMHMASGRTERRHEIHEENKAKEDLQTAARDIGRLKTFGKGFGKEPISQTVMETREAKLKEHFDKVATLLGHDKATALREEALNHGMKTGTRDLQEDAKSALVKAANTYGHALGYNNGFGNTPHSQEHHDANKAAMMAIHDKAKTILSPETLKSITTQQVETAKNQGLAQHKAERDAAAKFHKEKVALQAHTKGLLAAVGKSPSDAQSALHANSLALLAGLIGNSEALKVREDAFKAGKEEGQKQLKDSLHKASFAMGQHAGKGTTPTPAEKASAEEFHTLVKQHIGADHADKISKDAYEEGKKEALSPKIIPAKVHQEMKDLGLKRFMDQDPELGAKWAQHMPGVSPKEFFKGFFGEDSTPSNLTNLNYFKFSESPPSLYFKAYNIQLYGSHVDSIGRSFNFSDQPIGSCPAHYVEHDILQVKTADQDKGAVGKMFNALMGKGADGKCLYEKMGMKGAHVHGTLACGSYVWPSFGFHYDNEKRQESHQRSIKRELGYALGKISTDPNLATASHINKYLKTNNIKLPNADGTSSVREITPKEHQVIVEELAAIHNNLDNSKGNLASGFDLTKIKTPMLNTLFTKVIAEDTNIKKSPTFVKRLMMGDQHHFYGQINFTGDNPQITAIRANLNKK